MTVMTWPAALPPPERGTWGLTPQEARVRRPNEAGPPGYRRRFSAVAEAVNLSVILTRDERAIFDRFHRVDCRQGSLVFRMPDATTDLWPLLGEGGEPLLLGDGTPLVMAATWLCAWGDQPPSTTIVGTEFRIGFSVWVLP